MEIKCKNCNSFCKQKCFVENFSDIFKELELKVYPTIYLMDKKMYEELIKWGKNENI